MNVFPFSHKDYADSQIRIRHQVMTVSPINFKTEGDKLAELIKSYNMD